ncbi:MAG: DUF6607 family protein, partial [Candidatus Binatia bacterium]
GTMARMRIVRALVIVALVIAGVGCARMPKPPRPDGTPAASRQYTFAWRYGTDDGSLAPRGGTSRGPAVTLDAAAGTAWERVHAPSLTPLERDRRAILAMAGTFRTTFDFLEVMGFKPGFKPDRPYQSWGTEYVYVVRDEPRFISLQHLLVMFMPGADGKVAGPFVTKHWRQDWRHQDTELVTYRGRLTWARERLSSAAARGAWTQSVYQVDDSPRYAALGRWEHFAGVSTWRSDRTWRPLPRREWSVRRDYDVLIGTNQVTITPTGWVHQEDNLKVALDPVSGAPGATVSKELGLNRYERIVGFDDAAGRQYQQRTEPFWAEVRRAWADVARRHPRFTLRAAPDEGQLFVPLFEYAEKLDEGAAYDAADARAFATRTVGGYLAPRQ